MSLRAEGSLSVLNRGGGAAAQFCARLLVQLGARSLSAGNPLPTSSAIMLDDTTDAARSSDLAARGHVAIAITSGMPGGGTLDGIPLEAGIPAALAGAHAAVVALAAWRHAAASSTGARIELSALDVLATCLGDDLPAAVCARAQERPPSTRSTDPFVLRCRDGHIGVAIPTPQHDALFAALVGAAGADPIHAAVAWAAQRTRIEAFKEAQLWRLPAAPVLDLDESQGDEQSIARHSWGRDPSGKLRPASPFRFFSATTLTGTPSGAEGYRALPLSGVVVLDLGQVWAGPHCGELLVALGATVVKVERPTRPDGPRPPEGWNGCSGAFADLNRGKLSLAIDLATPDGREAFLRLVEHADVLIENFSPRVMPNLALGWTTLHERNPRLVALSMSAFGSGGPWANAVSYGSGLELASGLWALDEDGVPRAAPIPYLDYLAGAFGAAGIIAALIARDTSGIGAWVELAQREAAFQLLADGEAPVRRGPAFVVDAAAVAGRLFDARSDLLAPPAEGPCAHFARPPWRVYDLAAPETPPAPTLGQHSRMVLSTLGGLNSDAIDSLVHTDVILDRAEANPESSTP